MNATLRDDLSVGKPTSGACTIYRWDLGYAGRPVATFPREDEAWGVVSLILEYAELGHTIDDAISLAVNVYKMALHGIWRADTLAAAGPDPADAAYQDHAHAMATYPD